MSATTRASRRLVIEDFKAGIFSDYHATGAALPAGSSTFDPKVNGAAVIEDTWGCCADRSGALVPLPRVTTGRTEAFLPADARGTIVANNYTLDALVIDGMQEDNEFRSREPEVVVMQTWLSRNADLEDSVYLRVRRHEMWRAGDPTGDVAFAKAPAPFDSPLVASGNMTPFRGAVDEVTFDDYRSIRKGFVFVARPADEGFDPEAGPNFVDGIMSAADRALTDYDEKYALDNVDTAGAKDWPERCRDSLFGYYPNFDTPASIFPRVTGFLDNADNDDFRGGFMCVGHQGRIVVAQAIPSRYHDAASDQFTWKDRLSATGLLDVTTPVSVGEFVEENTSGIGALASLSADELLVVKHTGGGYLVRGSFESPAIIKLPFIESTYGIVSSPVATPIGLVYGTRNGVFVWEGETSKHISPQIDGFFWNPAPATQYEGHQARFGFWHPWVMAPNGYLFDTRHSSWWRLDNPADHEPYSVYAISERNRLYAFPFQITPTRNVLWNQAEPGTQANRWSWKSQPLVETRDQAFKVRDITVLATAADAGSTLTITITGFDEDGTSVAITPVALTMSANVDRPQIMMADVVNSARALTYMQVRIEASNTNPALAAPKLHHISFGVEDVAPVKKR